MREATNKVFIEGILSSVNLKDSPYMKDGRPIDSIRGTFDVRVPNLIKSNPDLIITCSVFANKMTTKGTLNPSYVNMRDFMDNYKSIAATGSEQLADKIRFTGKLVTSLYKATKDKYQIDVRVSFINRIMGEFKPQAKFETEGYLYKIDKLTDNDGIELVPKELELTFVVPGWNNTVDVLKVCTKSPKLADDIEHYWSVGNSYSLSGVINFYNKTDVVIDDSGIGESVRRESTTFNQELVMLSGSQALPSNLSFECEDIEDALVKRSAYIASKKESYQNIRKAPAADVSDFDF